MHLRARTEQARFVGALSGALCVAAGHAAGPWTAMVVFGDSLSDTGTSLKYTTTLNGTLAGTDIRPAGPHYAAGRWTNGLGVGYAGLDLAASNASSIWHWKVADDLGVPRPQNVYTGAANKTNYASGGAVTGAGQQFAPFPFGAYPTSDNIGYQVNNLFLGSTPTMSESTIYALMGGGNDVRDAVRSGAANSAATSSAVGKGAATRMAAHITALATRATEQNKKITVLWPNLVPMHKIPDLADAYGGNAGWRTHAETASTAYRDEWTAQVNALRAAHPNNLVIKTVDLYQYFIDVLAGTIGGTGLTNTTDPILKTSNFSDNAFAPLRNDRTAGMPAALVVPSGANPNAFAFWDPVHPTARVHELMGAYIAAQVPVPGGAVMLVLVGVVARRRRR